VRCGVRLGYHRKVGKTAEGERMEIYEAIRNRRSVRRFDGTPVERAVLERIIGAAGAAPSSRNTQPWHFHVTTGATRDAVCGVTALSTVHLQEYLDMLPPTDYEAAERFFASLGNAPVVIVVSVPVPEDEPARINDTLGTGCAIENLMLAAFAEGLGCCNITFSFWVRDKLSDLLGIPDDREIISLVLMGHPVETPEPVARRTDVATYLD
jgi:nitroreductase